MYYLHTVAYIKGLLHTSGHDFKLNLLRWI